MDAYRLGGGLDEMEDLDLDVSLPESVVVVEWGDGKVEELSEDRLRVVIDRAVGDTRRRAPHGDAGGDRRALVGTGAELSAAPVAGPPGEVPVRAPAPRRSPALRLADASDAFRQDVGKMLRGGAPSWSHGVQGLVRSA